MQMLFKKSILQKYQQFKLLGYILLLWFTLTCCSAMVSPGERCGLFGAEGNIYLVTENGVQFYCCMCASGYVIKNCSRNNITDTVCGIIETSTDVVYTSTSDFTSAVTTISEFLTSIFPANENGNLLWIIPVILAVVFVILIFVLAYHQYRARKINSHNPHNLKRKKGKNDPLEQRQLMNSRNESLEQISIDNPTGLPIVNKKKRKMDTKQIKVEESPNVQSNGSGSFKPDHVGAESGGSSSKNLEISEESITHCENVPRQNKAGAYSHERNAPHGHVEQASGDNEEILPTNTVSEPTLPRENNIENANIAIDLCQTPARTQRANHPDVIVNVNINIQGNQ